MHPLDGHVRLGVVRESRPTQVLQQPPRPREDLCSRQLIADAEVLPEPEAEVARHPVGADARPMLLAEVQIRAPDVETTRVREDGLVVVRRGERHADDGTRPSG